jgi:hypothetical protein
MHGRALRLILWVAVALAGLSLELRTGTTSGALAGPARPSLGLRLPIPGAGRLATWIGGRPTGLIAGRRLDREAGWRDVRWEPREGALGLYLEVAGRVRFREAAILFADGGALHIDLRQVERRNGLFALAELDAGREVTLVAVMAQAVSSQAEVALRIEPPAVAPVPAPATRDPERATPGS